MNIYLFLVFNQSPSFLWFNSFFLVIKDCTIGQQFFKAWWRWRCRWSTEVDRYISWPGQAVSYKIGEIKIRELRKKAEEALGSDFNIRDFHEVILEQGVVTLPILEERVNAFIESNTD